MECKQLLLEAMSPLFRFSLDSRFRLCTVFMLMSFSGLSLASNTLEPAIEKNDQCLQAGLKNKEPKGGEYKTYFGGWTRFKKGGLITLAKCDQSDQQNWQVADDKVSGVDGELAVIRLGRKFVPIVSRLERGKHLRQVRYEQGRLVFDFRNKAYCLIGRGGVRFTARLLEDCVNSTEPKASRWVYGLPPDPGEAGLVGLDGIDSDQDGVRDDVQRFIEVEEYDSEMTRKAVKKMAIVMQKELVNAYDKEIVLQLEPESSAALYCLFHVTGKSRPYRKKLEAKAYNTVERLRAWNKINSHFSGMTFTLPDDLGAQCNFGVDNTAP